MCKKIHLYGPKYCPNTKALRWWPTLWSFGTGLVVMLIQKCIDKSFPRDRGITLDLSKRMTAIIMMTTLALTLAIICHTVEINQDFPTLVICRSTLPLEFSIYGIKCWVRFIIHLYLVVRTFIIWRLEKCTEGILTLVNVTLFVQSVIGTIIEQDFVAFHYLALLNAFSFEITVLMSTKKMKSLSVFTAWINIFVMLFVTGGSFRMVEEWNTNFGYHTGFRGLYMPMKTSWTHYYWVLITVSTVGFGDIVPSSVPGQVILMVVIVFCLSWFAFQFRYLKEIFKSKQNADININLSDLPRYHLVIGCDTANHLTSFLNAFPKDHLMHVAVLSKDLNSDFVKAARLFKVKIVLGNDPLKIIRDTRVFQGGTKSSIWILFNAMAYDNPQEIDHCTVHLVKQIKDRKCTARLFVKVADVETKFQIHQVEGWRGPEGTDVCIVSQILDAQMLNHSAHARITAALLASASTTMTLDVAEKKEPYVFEEFVEVSLRHYNSYSALFLGSINIYEEVILTEYLQPGDKTIILKTDEKKKCKTFYCHKEEDHSCSDISTISIFTPAPSIHNRNEALSTPLSEDSPPTDELADEKITTFSSKYQNIANNTFDLLNFRNTNVNKTVISSLDHRYRICLHENCVCGIFENHYLSDILLVKAYENTVLYNVWNTIIQGDYLIVEEIQVDTHYCCVFDTMVRKRKIPLGLEIYDEISSGITVRRPVLNPQPSLRVGKGSYVVCFQSK